MQTYSKIYEARKALGPIPPVHGSHGGVMPSTGNIIGAKGYYAACVRGHKARIDCPPQFWPADADRDGYLSDYDIKGLPRYAPQSLKNRIKRILEIRGNAKTLCVVIVRHFRKGEAIYCGAFLIDSDENTVLYSDYSKTRYCELLDEYRKRLVPRF